MTLQVCVLGGTGFIGQAIVARLGAPGHAVKVLTRNPAQHRDLKVLPSLRLVRADVHDDAALEYEFDGCDVVDQPRRHPQRDAASGAAAARSSAACTPSCRRSACAPAAPPVSGATCT